MRCHKRSKSRSHTGALRANPHDESRLMENHKTVPKCDLFVHAHKFSLSLTKPQLTSNDLPAKEKYWAVDSTVKKYLVCYGKQKVSK